MTEALPVLARPWTMALAVIYLALTLAVGVWARRYTRTSRDFFIAGQRLGLLVTALATMSAAFSGFVFLGGPGLTYSIGIGSLFINLPVGFTAALLCWVVARKLRRLAAAREVFTIPDAFFHRFGSRPAQGLAAVAVLVGAVAYLAAQVLALGVLLEAIFGTREVLGVWSLPVAMAAGLLVIVFYSAAGGMVAAVYSDVLQGALMLAAAVGVFATALAVAGGPAAIVESIAASEAFGPGFLEPFGRLPPATACGFLFVFGVGVLGQPHMLHKFYMLRNERDLRFMPAALAGSQTLCLLIWLGLGLAVPALVAQGRLAPLAHPDDAAPAFLLGFAPAPLAGLAFAAVLAAIMSTADSLLNIGSAALVRDLPRAFGRPFADELRWGRWATAAIGVSAPGLAYGYGDLIALLGTFAFGTFAAALAPALAVGLNWRRVNAAAASASIATGLLLNIGLELLARRGGLARLGLVEGVLPSAVALAASFVVLFAVTWLSGRRASRINSRIRLIVDDV